MHVTFIIFKKKWVTHHGCAATKQTLRIQSPINLATGQPFTIGTGPGLFKAKEIVQALCSLGSSFRWEGHSQVRLVQPLPAWGGQTRREGRSWMPAGVSAKT